MSWDDLLILGFQQFYLRVFGEREEDVLTVDSSTMAMSCMNHHLHSAAWRSAQGLITETSLWWKWLCARQTDGWWRDARNLKNHSRHSRQSPRRYCVLITERMRTRRGAARDSWPTLLETLVQLENNYSLTDQIAADHRSHHKSSANACQKRAKETRKLRSEALFSDNSWNFRHDSLLSIKPPTTDSGPRQVIIRREKKSYQTSTA